MRPNPTKIAKTRKRVVRSKSFREAEKKAGYVSVCLIGWEGPRPRYFGDNQGCWPVRVATSKKEKTVAKNDDLATPHVGVVLLEWVAVPSEEHAKRLKAALDRALHGEMQNQGNEPMRHSWKDLSGVWDDEQSRSLWWGIILDQALKDVKQGARQFETMDGAERDRRITAQARRGR